VNDDNLTFYAKLANQAYQATSPQYILSPLQHYNDSEFTGSVLNMTGYTPNNLEDRRVLYEKVALSPSLAEHLLIYIPINRDLNLTTPILCVFRGTSDAYDVISDLSLASHYVGLPSTDFYHLNTLISQSFTAIKDVLDDTNTLSENVKFISHSLGSFVAMSVHYQLEQQTGNYGVRITNNIMYNPYILASDIYDLCLAEDSTFKNKFVAHIIKGDYASVIYKRNPIGSLVLYDNIIEPFEITSLENLSYNAFSALSNHSITAWLEGQNLLPQETHIHYDVSSVNLTDKHIDTKKVYGLIGFDVDPLLTAEHLTLKSTTDAQGGVHWWLDSINLNSHQDNYDSFEMNMTVANKRYMLYRYGRWSMPLIMNGDTTKNWYLVRANTDMTQGDFYLAYIETNSLYYVRVHQNIAPPTGYTNPDHSSYLKSQLTTGTPAFVLSQQNTLNTNRSYGDNSFTHQAYWWNIGSMTPHNHAGDLRRIENISYTAVPTVGYEIQDGMNVRIWNLSYVDTTTSPYSTYKRRLVSGAGSNFGYPVGHVNYNIQLAMTQDTSHYSSLSSGVSDEWTVSRDTINSNANITLTCNNTSLKLSVMAVPDVPVGAEPDLGTETPLYLEETTTSGIFGNNFQTHPVSGYKSYYILGLDSSSGSSVLSHVESDSGFWGSSVQDPATMRAKDTTQEDAKWVFEVIIPNIP